MGDERGRGVGGDGPAPSRIGAKMKPRPASAV